MRKKILPFLASFYPFDPVTMKPVIPYRYSTRRVISQKKREWEQCMEHAEPYPGSYSGRGIVTCGGGLAYFTCAWVNISLLRRKGCTLPVELWYVDDELEPRVMEQLAALGVTCKNIHMYTPHRLKSYQIKPFAIKASAFREVLFLDADNVAVRDPSYLFGEEAYLTTGAVFWPDNNCTGPENPIWQIINRHDYRTPDQESGQVLLDKQKCWEALRLCLHFNLDHEYYYKILYGDKDTFRFAWLALGQPFHMIGTEVAQCGNYDDGNKFRSITMVQHDPAGNILFLHRNSLKWHATPGDRLYWQEVRKFAPGTTNKKYRWNPHSNGHAMEMQGDLMKTAFTPLFGDLESECLDILGQLRAAPFYADFVHYAQRKGRG